MRNMLYWWIFFWVQVVAFAFAGYLGVFKIVLKADISYISFGIMALHALTTCWIGLMTKAQATSSGGYKYHQDSGWFFAEVAMMLGMIGTIIGFVYTLTTTLGGGSLDPAQLNMVVAGLAKGIGTAGWTTLFGLIACLSIKLQMNNLEALGHKQDISSRNA